MLQKTTTTPTKQEPVEINLRLVGKTVTQSEEHKKLLTNIMERYNAMRSARIPLDRLWQIAQLQFEAMYIPYADGRARSNVPLEWAIVELFVAEALSRIPKVDIAALSEDSIPKVEPMRRVMDFVDKGYIKEQLYRNEYITSIYGTGYYLTALKENQRVIREIEYNDDDTETVTKKLLTENKIIIKALDPRFVYLDDRTNDFEDDVDQVFIDYITPEKLLSLKNNKQFISEAIDQVGESNKSDMVFFTKEDRGKLSNNVVELMHYFNKESDQYVIIANRSVIIKEWPNPYAHKQLPIVPRPYGYNPMSKMGRGLCEALVNFKSQINQMNEMIMDGIRRSNNSLFVVGNGLTFDGNSFGFNNTLIKANGKLWPENFQEIRGQQPNSAIFQFSQDILRQVAIYVGIDPASIIGQASSTAFETAVRQESSLKRVNVVLTNRDIALQKVYERHIANIQQFFPKKIAKGLSGISKEPETQYPTIMLDGEKYINGEFVKYEGKFPFEVKPDYIRGQYDIKVETNFNSPTLKQLKLQRYQDFVRTANEYSMAIQNNPAMAQAIPTDDFIQDMAQEYDIDLSAVGWAEGSIAKEKKELMKQIQMITNTQEPAQVEQGQTEPTQPAQPGQEGIREKIGGIMTPKTPNINNTSPALKWMM